MKKCYTLVVAEDEAAVCAGLTQLLEQAGHSVLATASNACDTVSAVTALSPDVLLLDVELEASDGLEAAGILMDLHPTPIVVCSAHANTDLFCRAAKAGVGAYLVKPFRLSELIAAIVVSCERFSHWHCDRPKVALDVVGDGDRRPAAQIPGAR